MHRHRQLEILCANAALKVVSNRYAPGTSARLLLFLADRGAVSRIIEEYQTSGNIEQCCLSYWSAMLEPDALRLEDLVSTVLISFATSFAASLLIEGGKAAFPALYERYVKRGSMESTIASIAKMELLRRKHLETLLDLLSRKAESVDLSQAELQQDLNSARAHLLKGETLESFVATITRAGGKPDLRPIESAVRGTILTEEQRETSFQTDGSFRSDTSLSGLPLSEFFGVGQIVHSWLNSTGRADQFGLAYESIEDFVRDVNEPLRDAHKHAYLKQNLHRSPKKILPLSDLELGSGLIDHNQ